jgi:3-isopropylmalate/(R)-2-methylmalate dehydratase small subunit
VIAPSFGDIHYANQLQNGMLPVVLPAAACLELREQLRAEPGSMLMIDLAAQTVTASHGVCFSFDIDATYKERLLSGTDDISLILEHLPEMERFEAKHRREMSWLAGADGGRER